MKYIFLHTHHGAPYKDVLESLSKIPGTYACRSETTYEHPNDLLRLKDRDRWSTTFVDTILENKELQSDSVMRSVVNIYLVGNNDGGRGDDYLRFRLRRMYEIWRKVGGFVLNKGWEGLEEKFETRLNRVEVKSENPLIDKYLSKFGC